MYDYFIGQKKLNKFGTEYGSIKTLNPEHWTPEIKNVKQFAGYYGFANTAIKPP